MHLLQVILELKETNKDLLDGINGGKSTGRESVKSKISVSPPRVEDASPTLEADDSKTDVSLIEHTPAVKKTGRGRGKGRVNRRYSNSHGAISIIFLNSLPLLVIMGLFQ